jgi:response regulator RpfG family c-di-GMP phosphodiesterase
MTQKGRLLIVDDDMSFLQQISDILEEAGYDPVTFNSGAAVLNHLRETPETCMMLLDIHMPNRTGVEVIRALQEQKKKPSVILMTAHANLQTAIECLRLGAEDYITKPLDLDLLLLTLERVEERLALRRSNEELGLLLAEHAKDTERSQKALKALTGILRVQSAPQDFPQTSFDVVTLLHELLESSQSSICLRANGRNMVFHVPPQGLEDAVRTELERILDWVVTTRESLREGAPSTPGPAPVSDYFKSFPASIFMPVRAVDRAFGAIQISRVAGKPQFTTADFHLLELLSAEISVLHSNARLYENYEKMTIGAITSLAKALQHKDDDTGEHSRRTHVFLNRTLDRLDLPRYERDLIGFAMRLHDIGKIRVPNRIIRKPAPLDDNEWEIMRMHPVWGFDILNSEGMLSDVAVLVRHHHERFDGTGYPDGLKGNYIPLGSRVLSVIDAYDAMRSNRPYRNALPLSITVDEIKTNIGTQFDPDIATCFLESISQGTESITASPN